MRRDEGDLAGDPSTPRSIGTSGLAEPTREWLHHRDCWGCGPDNPLGLQLEPRRDEVDGSSWRVTFTADALQHGPPGRVHGGLLAVPMDCLASWAAIDDVRRRAVEDGRDPDATVALTGTYTVRLAASTPTGVPLELRARVAERDGRRVTVRTTVVHDDEVTATFDAVFVEVASDLDVRDRPPDAG